MFEGDSEADPIEISGSQGNSGLSNDPSSRVLTMKVVSYLCKRPSHFLTGIIFELGVARGETKSLN